MHVLTRLLRARAEDVTLEVPTRTFDVTFPRSRRFLFWRRMRLVRRRFVVGALPLRELLVMHEKIERLAAEFSRLAVREACVVIVGADALRLNDRVAREMWEWWHEVNCLELPKPRPGNAPPPARTSPVLDLVFRLERFPFNFETEQVMRMTAAEAIARLEEFARTNRPPEESSVA